MTPEDKQLAARVLEKNKGLEGIWANPDFQDWLELVPKAELEYIKTSIVTIDRKDDRWKERVCELVIQYQALHRGIFDLTTIRLQAVKSARKKLQEVEME